MKTFLITGGSGFIGSHLSELLVDRGHRVFAVDNLSTGRLDNIASLQNQDNFEFIRANITDRIVIERLASQADTIFHLAAAVGVKLIVDDPVGTIETNIHGTEAILEDAVRYDCRVLLASTSEVYGKGTSLPFSEEDDVRLGPTTRNRWAYAASKMVDEFLAFAYAREFNLEVTPFRLFNTVGPRQTGRYGMVIPRFVRQALAGDPITVYGDGTQRRCFCDVRDVVLALCELASHKEASGSVYNIGGTNEISIQELARKVRALTDSDSEITNIPYEEAYGPEFEDMERRLPDIAKVQSLLDWRPQRSLDETIQDVIVYEKNRDPLPSE